MSALEKSLSATFWRIFDAVAVGHRAMEANEVNEEEKGKNLLALMWLHKHLFGCSIEERGRPA